MPAVQEVFRARTMPNLFQQVLEYMNKFPPNAYSTSVIRGGVKIEQDQGREYTEYWVTVDRLSSCE